VIGAYASIACGADAAFGLVGSLRRGGMVPKPRLRRELVWKTRAARASIRVGEAVISNLPLRSWLKTSKIYRCLLWSFMAVSCFTRNGKSSVLSID
jgi:hypothetical protein